MTHEKLMNKPELTQEEANAALRLSIRQTESCLGEFSQQFKSIFSEGGFYSPAPNEQWTNGFWTGELWLAYENSGDDRFREAAAKQIDSFLTRIETGNRTDTHDLGFLYSLSCVAGYKLTGNQTARKAALLAADRLKARFHQKGRFIQAWGSLENRNNYRLIIDCLLNLPLLYWATEETGLPEYADVARAHLETALSVIIRPDYSTYLAAAKRMMKALVDLCSVTSPEISNGQLLHGVYGKKTPYNDCIDHGIDECNLWGDYYYVEALTRMTKDWNPYW